ncbi:MAG TPA: PilC/PilY family type IV pilus protein [Roseateles sp.]
MKPHQRDRNVRLAWLSMALSCAALCATMPADAQTALADQPVFSAQNVPGNLALALSVEFPTAISVAHVNRTYNVATTYKGYFDPEKCYVYNYVSDTSTNNYFYPAGAASSHACTGKWSGNYLNWATMQTIDPFRWVLTGGYRVQDTTSITVLEKAWAPSGLGGLNNFPDSSITTGVSGATPVASGTVSTRIFAMGNKIQFRIGDTTGLGGTATHYNPAVALVAGQLYEAFVRVKVCDSSNAAGGLEANCVAYGNSYKPEGLMQKYAEKIRFSAFGYLNDSDLKRDGGVLRARMKFIGPTKPVPGGLPVGNSQAEWSSSTGIFVQNPDSSDATATTTATGVSVVDSGVMNYLNKFGQFAKSYKTYDPVGELFYSVLRYYRNVGNVSSYTTMGNADAATKTKYVDGFPVITSWDDPIQYSCQKNFILGIGDVNTHADRNLPGATGGNEPSQPSEVASDTLLNATTATNKVGDLAGISSLASKLNYPACCNLNGPLMAGLAYYANTKDMRTDLPGMQTVQTYWLDVLENQTFYSNNQYYLAAKYGGFTVPDGFNPDTRTTDLDATWWRTNTDTVGSQPRPDNYFTAGNPDLLINGLTQAFSSIASKVTAYSTSFSTALPQVSVAGTTAFSAKYDAKSWTGELMASTASFDPQTGAPTLVPAWTFSSKLGAQASGSGWDSGRNVVTYRPDTKVGVAFRTASLSTSQLTALDTAYVSGDDSSNYLNYLRGERKNEKSSTVSGSTQAYRDRSVLVGDIVNSKARPVGPPSLRLSEATNPGYAAFKSSYANRPLVVYVGTNFGMLHAVNGSVTGSDAGKELFAYIPSVLFNGPTATPTVNGLQAVGNPNFVHYNFFDGTPVSADVDFGKTVGGSGTNWRSLVLGGLGKGGKALYAIDATDPAGVTSEASAASRVLWEFTDADMGYGYGQPNVVKTKKYGWVVVAGSGYNNADGKGYFYFINPRTGALLEKVSTGVGTATTQAGLAHVQAFMPDLTNGTADAIYAGDLLGNLWRLDVTAASGNYPAPVKLAILTDAQGAVQPVTSRPTVAVQPGSNRRYVTVGTGRLLDGSDISSAQAQRFYAIIDGNNNKFSVDGQVTGDKSTLPDGWTFPHTISRFKQQTDVTKAITVDLATQIGWFLDLGTAGSGGPGWRVISDPATSAGTVAFAATIPSSTNPCSSAGASRVYALDLGSASTILTDAKGYYSPAAGVVIDLSYYSVRDPSTAETESRLEVGTNCTNCQNLDVAPTKPPAPPKLKRFNWREITLSN